MKLLSWLVLSKLDYFFSDRNKDRKVRIGENIHKFCCYSTPHCPKDFFHNLLFPPSAGGVVKDWYNQELANYDFSAGKKKTTSSQIKHFTNIVWKKTTKIGCAQSTISGQKCIYTIVLYEEEGSTGTEEDFKKNVGSLRKSFFIVSMRGCTYAYCNLSIVIV